EHPRRRHALHAGVARCPELHGLADPARYRQLSLGHEPRLAGPHAAAARLEYSWSPASRRGSILSPGRRTNMLSVEDNELITNVEKGSPMGEVFRRFWLPLMLSSELP